MNISSNFDSGNIIVQKEDGHGSFWLNIRKDTQSDHFQWFHFRLNGARGVECQLVITNASEASYPEGWEDYDVRASYDRENWFSVPTTYEEGKLIWHFKPEHDSVFFAYFAPYSYERHLGLIHSSQHSPDCRHKVLGQTHEGRDLDMLVVGNPKAKRKIWVVARQHPGEAMAEWFMEGFIDRLIDDSDPESLVLLKNAVFYLVPNLNPDGAIAGNLRCNTLGTNLNREWAAPSKEKSPEVYYLMKEMDKIGCDLFLDIHGDEGLPYNFVSSIEGIPSFDKRLKNLLDKFLNKWKECSPDFQTRHGYPKNKAGEANLSVGSKQIGERFKCLSMTIEMPFKDNADLPDEYSGWSPERSMNLGRGILFPIRSVLRELR